MFEQFTLWSLLENVTGAVFFSEVFNHFICNNDLKFWVAMNV